MKFRPGALVCRARARELPARTGAALTACMRTRPAAAASRAQVRWPPPFAACWREKFESFDDRPAAAASSAKCTGRSGPTATRSRSDPTRARQALRGDLNQRPGSPAVRILDPGHGLKPLLPSCAARVAEELDYAAKCGPSQHAMGLANAPYITFPRGRAGGARWGHRVLPGVPGDRDRLVHPAQREPRGHAAGQVPVTSARTGPGCLPADPHPGNFR